MEKEMFDYSPVSRYDRLTESKRVVIYDSNNTGFNRVIILHVVSFNKGASLPYGAKYGFKVKKLKTNYGEFTIGSWRRS